MPTHLHVHVTGWNGPRYAPGSASIEAWRKNAWYEGATNPLTASAVRRGETIQIVRELRAKYTKE